MLRICGLFRPSPLWTPPSALNKCFYFPVESSIKVVAACETTTSSWSEHAVGADEEDAKDKEESVLAVEAEDEEELELSEEGEGVRLALTSAVLPVPRSVSESSSKNGCRKAALAVSRAFGLHCSKPAIKSSSAM